MSETATDILILERARRALQFHHDWHLAQTDEVDLGDGISITPADEYGDSSMWEETVSALDSLNEEIKRRTNISVQ